MGIVVPVYLRRKSVEFGILEGWIKETSSLN